MPEYDSVGTVAFFRERHRIESATTTRVLAALPADSLSYTPHAGSSTAGTTAWTIVRGLRVALELLRSPSAAIGLEGHPDHHALVSQFAKHQMRLLRAL